MNIDPLTGVIAVSVAVVIVTLFCYSPPPTDIHNIGPGGDGPGPGDDGAGPGGDGAGPGGDGP
jgi:hypothetical protein